MCSAAELVELRKELQTLRGHYKEIGKSLGTLHYMENQAQELNERLTSLSRAAQTASQKYSSSKGRSHAGDLVNADLHNGFDIDVTDLTFHRLLQPDPTPEGFLPVESDKWLHEQLKATEAFVEEMAAWCDERQTLFCDPDPVPLLPHQSQGEASERGQRIGSPCAAPVDKSHGAADAAARDRERTDEVGPVLERIRIWRRLSRAIRGSRKPVIFARGNELLLNRPRGEVACADHVRTLAKLEQGLLNDSWFQLALALVAMRRSSLSNLFVSTEHSDVGLFAFEFYATPLADYPRILPGEEPGWRVVVVDDLVPCAPAARLADGRLDYTGADGGSESPRGPPSPGRERSQVESLPIFGITDQKGEMWAVMVQKAYAKFLGAYSRLHNGDTAQAMMHLTGGRTTVMQWDGDWLDEGSKSLLWWQLRQAARFRLLVACMMCPLQENKAAGGSSVVIRAEGEYLQWRTGDALITTCELSPASLRDWGVDARARSGARLVKLRSLRGNDEWDGDWSHTSPLWKPGARDYVNYGTMDEHIMWMRMQDYVRHYNTILLCSEFALGPASFYGVMPASSTLSLLRHAEQYLLTVHPPPEDQKADCSGPLPVSICCTQPDRNSTADEFAPRHRVPIVQPLELQLRLCRGDRLIEPELAEERPPEEEQWCFSSTESGEVPMVFRWPAGEELELRRAGDEANSFELLRRVDLNPGNYVVSVHQRVGDEKFEIPFFIAFLNDEDECGATAPPWDPPASPTSPRGEGRSPPPPARPRSGCSITAAALGSAAAPRCRGQAVNLSPCRSI